MRLNDYSVRVVGGNEVAGGYVEMNHGQTFQLALRNDTNRRCDARVKMNGVVVGTWRVNAYSSALLERPAEGDGKFAFYQEGTSESYAVQAQGGPSFSGLISVTFTPERQQPQVSYSYTASAGVYRGAYKGIDINEPEATITLSHSDYSSGVIGQTGHSNQVYGNASSIEYDYSGQTVISLRLVAANNNGPRPLTQRANPVPPPVR